MENIILLIALFTGAWLLVGWIKTLMQSKGISFMSRAVKILIVVGLVLAVGVVVALKQQGKDAGTAGGGLTKTAGDRPRLVDLGANKCIPCQMMKPILDELREEYKGRFDVVFIDVWENPDEAKKYGINLIPTQIFYDKDGEELFRHEGFFSKEDILAKWEERGITFEGAASSTPVFERFEPAEKDTRPREQVCYMCDGDIRPETLVTVSTDKGDVRICGLHCYFIMYSCLTEDKTDFEKKVTVTDFASGGPVPLTEVVFLSGMDTAGRPVIQSYSDRSAAEQTRQISGGSVIDLKALTQNELSHTCGFCDRACYPQDAAKVLVSGIQTWGCCSHCALGVAARTGQDIEVYEKDRLTGEPVVIKTLNGSVASLEPSTAVAWYGQRQKADGTWGSAGCFHQGFFATADNLKQWVRQNPYETGQLISVHQALADKMKLSPAQIQNACKIGECSPK